MRCFGQVEREYSVVDRGNTRSAPAMSHREIAYEWIFYLVVRLHKMMFVVGVEVIFPEQILAVVQKPIDTQTVIIAPKAFTNKAGAQ